MKKSNLFIICFFILCSFSRAQVGSNIGDFQKNQRHLMIVSVGNGPKVICKVCFFITSEIEEMEAMPYPEVLKKYPDSDLVTTVILKKGVRLLNLNQVLDKFKVQQQYRNYKVLCEDREVVEPNMFMASESSLAGVVVNKEKQFINIVSKENEKLKLIRIELEKNRIETQERLKQR